MASDPTPRAGSVLEVVEVETPEHIAFSYEVAGLGTRFCALLIDSTLVALGIIGLAWLLLRVPWPEVSAVEEMGPRWVAFLWLMVFFVLYWGYFLAFEVAWDGQTPGKKWMGIRAVADGGFPIPASAAAIRNLLRLVDMQPAGFYFVGAVTMLLNREAKRLGDLAGGTLVVRERTAEAAVGAPEGDEPAAVGEAEAGGPPKLDEREYALLRRFLARRPQLTGSARSRLEADLVRCLGDRYPAGAGESDEERLLRAWRIERARRRPEGRGAGAEAPAPFAERFVRRQEPRWREFARRAAGAYRRGLIALEPGELAEFAALYRETAADLARARTYGVEERTRGELERLVAAGHSLLYRRRRPSPLRWLRFLRREFPALVRRHGFPIGVSAAFLLLPALIGYVRVRSEPDSAHRFLHPEIIARADAAPARAAEGRGYVEVPSPFMPVFAGGIIANNVQVTFTAFALGITAGLGTILLLLFNGLHIGATLGLFDALGTGPYLWSFVLPHGIVELTAAAIAGGAGLLLGSALVLPGERTRREALIERGRTAVRLLLGTTALLVLAGLVEGFVSPSALPGEMKMTFGLLLGGLLFAYLFLTRNAEPSEELEDGSWRGRG